jgi:protein-S-isoprenylcysteine O-methyltransferase Ste14
MIGIPLALGSFWGLVFVVPGLIVLPVRIVDEEKVGTTELAGYPDYTRQVHYRLVPTSGDIGMMKVLLQALAASLFGIIVMGLLLFLPAGTFNYWQAWVFIAIFTVATTCPNIYLAMRRPEVLRRRLQAGPAAETRPAQRLASIGYFVFFAAVAVVSALDHRFGWSTVPTAVVVLGDVMVAVGLGIAMLAILQNSFAASRVTVESGQNVVSTGLYGFVRHPMYFGLLIMMIGAPIALDSYWGFVLLVPGLAVFALRILDEEKLLRAELGGYADYTEKVRARLVPYVW